MSFFSVNGVTKKFGGLRAVNHVTFSMERGEIVGLLGPNGSGKTTLINLISGALPVTAGQISVLGTNLTGLRSDQIAKAGVARTFQLVRILPSLSLIENVMIPAVFGRNAHTKADAHTLAIQSLDMVGLSDRANVAAGDLTYIDQKRLELARALAAEPEVLLLDEWLAGLNPTELLDGILLIKKLNEKGLTILMVEHILEAVRNLCPRVVVMNSGMLIADEKTDAALSDPTVISAYLGEMVDA